jgi:1-acyl-sn-glycerol-3-phosphate acyltransferase
MRFHYRMGWLGFRSFFKTYFRGEIFNAERVPATGPVLLASNHLSYLDPPIIGASINREINYLARENVFRPAPIGKLLRSVNVIPLDRDGGGIAGLRTGMEILHQNQALILFPEGTRSPDGQLHRFRSGIGLIIIKSTAPVIPVRVFGAYEAFGRHHRFPRPRKISVKFGPAIDFSAQQLEAKTCSKPRLKEIYQEIADALRSAVSALEARAD